MSSTTRIAEKTSNGHKSVEGKANGAPHASTNSVAPTSEPRQKAARPVPSAEELNYERVWVRHRVNALFESDPAGKSDNILRRVAKAMRHDLDIVTTALTTDDFLETHDLERVLIVMYERLDAALDLDEYFERGGWGAPDERADRATRAAVAEEAVKS